MSRIKDLEIIKNEVARFNFKLKQAIDEEREYLKRSTWSRKKSASLKRSALDLKQELTRLNKVHEY